MKEPETKALYLRRKALDVLDGKLDKQDLLRELHRIERNEPELFEAVVKQLEADNDRWSRSSALPNVKVERDGDGRIQTISFHPVMEQSEEENEKEEERNVVVFHSDLTEREWAESFAKKLIDEVDRGKERK